MKALLPLLLLALLMTTGCDPNVSKADKAWKTSQKLTGHQQITEQEKAYYYYKKSVDKSLEAGKEIKPEVLNKYLEALIVRIEYFFEAQGVEMDKKTDAIPLFREDAERFIAKADVRMDIKDRYADFIMNSALAYKNDKSDMTRCMKELDYALTFAAGNKARIEEKRKEVAEEYAAEQVATAKNFLSSKETLDQIRAQFYAKVALEYNPISQEAQRILSDTRKELVKSYSAYISAIQNYPDKDLFKKINNQKIFMAVPLVEDKGNTLKISATMFNDAPNAVKLKPDYFKVTFENGESSTATAIKSKKKIVDQSFEGEFTLVFTKRGKQIHTLEYKRGELQSTKFFY